MNADTGAAPQVPAAQLLDAQAINRALLRLGHEIREQHPEVSPVLVGIRTRGAPLAARLAQVVEALGGGPVSVAAIDVSRHRDDRPRPTEPGATVLTEIGGGDSDVSIHGREVILVDDVVQTGRSLRAGIDALLQLGRPSRVEILVLVDRGQRELPLRASYVGKNVPAAPGERVQVRLRETDGVDGAWIAVGHSR